MSPLVMNRLQGKLATLLILMGLLLMVTVLQHLALSYPLLELWWEPFQINALPRNCTYPLVIRLQINAEEEDSLPMQELTLSWLMSDKSDTERRIKDTQWTTGLQRTQNARWPTYFSTKNESCVLCASYYDNKGPGYKALAIGGK